MIPFDLAEPDSLHEAAGLLDPEDPTVRPIAGGTALMLMMKAGLFQPSRLVSLHRVADDCRSIAARPDGGLTIGALTPLAALERSAEIRGAAPVIAATMRTLANIRVRNVATVGGALAHADPHMDLPPVLIALNAAAAVVRPDGERTIAVEDLLQGYYETALAPNELIARVELPPQGGRRSAYLKCTTRAADDWPALGIAVSIEGEGPDIRAARIVLGAATEKATRLRTAEAVLAGATADDATLARAGEAAVEEAQIITDPQGTAAYKRQLLRVYLARAVRRALEAA